MPDPTAAKRQLRREMRAVRRDVDDQDARSARIWARVQAFTGLLEARTIMAYASVPGEPDAEPFVDRCRAAGISVVVPAATPSAAVPDDPSSFDVVVVPGLAFDRRGGRLGQGGGWYDRVLAAVRPDCRTIGVCFAAQLIGEVPIEPHDIAVRAVVTDDEVIVVGDAFAD